MSLQSVGGAENPDRVVNKRVVLEHKGGMVSIAGEFKPESHEVKPFIELHVHGKLTPFGLTRITPRALYYRQIVAPEPQI